MKKGRMLIVLLCCIVILTLSLSAIAESDAIQKVKCRHCYGLGYCRFCGGRGKDLYGGKWKTCVICYGSGYCTICYGSGLVPAYYYSDDDEEDEEDEEEESYDSGSNDDSSGMENEKLYVTSVKGTVNVRSQPSMDGRVIGGLRYSQYLEYAGETVYDSEGNGWYSVYWEDGTGWMAMHKTTLYDPEVG